MNETRDYVLLYVNGERKTIRGSQAFLSLSDYLRNEEGLTGTKIVCSEGDCGACTILIASPQRNSSEANKKPNFVAINSCIAFVHLLDSSHILTVESLQDKKQGTLHPIQESMMSCHASQCGFCTPGFVMSLAGLAEKKKGLQNCSEKQVKNYLSGNLCRCTGYVSIIDAAMNVSPSQGENLAPLLQDRYHSKEIWFDLQRHQKIPLRLTAKTPYEKNPEKEYVAPLTIKEAVQYKKEDPERRIFSSATDLGVQINKERVNPTKIMGLNHIAELHEISLVDRSFSIITKNKIKTGTGTGTGTEKDDKEKAAYVSIGARANLTQIENFTETLFPEWAHSLHIFASLQIKNAGTLVGNIANGSPIGDTLPFLMVTEALIEMQGPQGIRRVPLTEFYLGYKKLNLQPEEIITRVFIPLPLAPDREIIKLYKVSKRKDLDISCVNAGFLLELDQANSLIKKIRISIGGVGPAILRMKKAEDFLQGKTFQLTNWRQATQLVLQDIHPLSDVRGSSWYRQQVVSNLMAKFFYEITQDEKSLEQKIQIKDSVVQK